VDWDTVGQVLAILAGAGTYQWWTSREPRPHRPPPEAFMPAAQRSLIRELETLQEVKRTLLLDYGDDYGSRGSASASVSWDAAERVEKRMTQIRTELRQYPSGGEGIHTETVY